MARSFDGRGSEKLYNEELYKLYEILQHFLDIPDTSAGPAASLDGALWLDRSTGTGELKFKNNDQWLTVFGDKFKMICEILSDTEPDKPIAGQLWLDNGVLKYYSGVDWIPVKSVNIDTEFNLSAFEQFLIISPIKPAGKIVINPEGSIINDLIEETFKTDNVLMTYTLTKGECASTGKTVNVFVNGCKLPKDYYEIIDSTHIRINDIIGTAMDNNVVTIDYKNNQSTTTIDTTYSQFLLPQVNLDRVFINGFHDIPSSFYEDCGKEVPENILLNTISNIALEYPTDDMENKSLAAVHVNPKKLTKITKYLFKINSDGYIPLTEYNTEFYAIKDGISKFLVKKPTADYEANSTGIILSQDIINSFDFVYAIVYEFDNAATGTGSLTKGVINLSKETSIYIGYVEDPEMISVFVQGLYLDPENNYTYDNGYIMFKLETNMDIGVIIWPKKETGTIVNFNEDGNAVIKPNKSYNHPLVMVYGLTLNEDYNDKIMLADYEIHTDENGEVTYILKNVNKPNLKYAIVETLSYDINGDIEENMFVDSGIVKKDTDGSIYIDLLETDEEGNYVLGPDNKEIEKTDLSTLSNVIVFANGILIAKNDVDVDTVNGRITIKNNNFVEGMDYTLLRDDNERYIFSNIISFNTIPIKTKSDATLVYIQNQLLTDANSLYTTYLPTTGCYNGEIKLLIDGEDQTWYIYNHGWKKIEDENLIKKLEDNTLNYVSDEHSISILKNYGNIECVYYSYQYANSIEYKLLTGNIRTVEGKRDYRVAYNHIYPYGHNSLFIWQNGLRQIPNQHGTKNEPDGIYELAGGSDALPGYFRVPQSINGSIFYVVEKPENTETKSCEYQVLTTDDIVEGSNNFMFKTNINLAAGNIRLFISGIRQPESAYKVIDSHTFIIDGKILCGKDFPEENVYVNGKLKKIIREHPDTILIETRPDYNLKEKTIKVRYNGQNEFLVKAINPEDPIKGGDSLPQSIINSNDFVMIYINGLAYGKNYTIDKDKQSIILNDKAVCKNLTKNDSIIFEWR